MASSSLGRVRRYRVLAILGGVAVALGLAASSASAAVIPQIVNETSPQTQLATTLAALQAEVVDFRPGRQKPGTIKIRNAIDDLQRSLDASLWTDGSHLAPGVDQKVFNDLKNSVQKLGMVEDPSAVVTGAGGTITQSAIDLAVIRYSELEGVLGTATVTDPTQALARAAEDLVRAQNDEQAGDLVEAIKDARSAYAELSAF